MYPGTVPVRDLYRVRHRIECPGVQVAGLQADDQRAPRVNGAQRLLERIGPNAALVIDGHGLRLAQSQVAERQVDRLVPLRADQNANARRSGESVAL